MWAHSWSKLFQGEVSVSVSDSQSLSVSFLSATPINSQLTYPLSKIFRRKVLLNFECFSNGVFEQTRNLLGMVS